MRLTGGEPLLRPDLTEVVEALRSGLPGADLALTTNGQLLRASLPGLVAAGVTRATVHVDTLRRDRYRELMGDHDVHDVLDATREARAQLREVKLNVVVQRTRNDDELEDFLAFSADTGIQVRFIEMMNTGSSRDYVRSTFISGAEIIARVQSRLGAEPVPRAHRSDPAALFKTRHGIVFGLIASDTEPFCADCNRMRLSADGFLRGCLYEAPGARLSAALAETTDEALAALVRGAVARKASHHPSSRRQLPLFSMSQTGG